SLFCCQILIIIWLTLQIATAGTIILFFLKNLFAALQITFPSHGDHAYARFQSVQTSRQLSEKSSDRYSLQTRCRCTGFIARPGRTSQKERTPGIGDYSFRLSRFSALDEGK